MKRFAIQAGVLLVTLATALLATARADALDEARSLMRQGRQDAAIERLDRYLESSPNDSTARFLKGVALAETGRRDEAIIILSALTDEFPDLPEPYNNLAVLYAAGGELEKARAALMEAIRIHPSYATAHENLGDVYGKMAALAYAKAIDLDSANKTAHAKQSLVNKLAEVMPAGRPGAPPVVARAAPAAKPAPTVAPEPSAAKAPAAAPAPSAKTTPPAARVPASNVRENVVAAVQDWADAWAGQDVEGYLEHYAASFIPADGRSREDWTILRRKRVSRPQFIDLRIVRPEVIVIDGSRAVVTFEQSYRSDTYADQVTKELELVKQGERWKITSERTVN